MRHYIAAVVLSAIIGMNAVAQESTLVTGYLVDKSCSSYIVKKGPAEAMVKAANHTRECCLMPECAKEGFGIVSGGKFLKFDAQGDVKAKAFLARSTREDHILVEINGAFHGDKLSVVSLKDATAPPPARAKKR